MKNYSIRPVAEEELARLHKIEIAVHASPWTLEHFQSELQKSFSQTWVMTDDETDEELVAYSVFWQMDQSIELLNLVVDPRFQRQGFAKKLLQKMIHEGVRLEVQSVKLDVRKSNQNAIQLYQAMGFVILHLRKSFYSDGESAYHMTLDLAQIQPTNTSLN